MTPTVLQSVLRRASRLVDDPSTPGASDAELLRRFAESREEAAFQTILERHGPLAWAVCRQMLADPTEAEDAFQATILALIQSAPRLGRVKSVGGWLHGVAVKICLKLRRSAVRRKSREQKSAQPEGKEPIDSTWDDLHAAVHEEVERLPAVLRAVFVLCELEGVRQPEVAEKLGCKLGTVSGRLTRARQSLLKALTARGFAPVLAIGTLTIGSSTAAVPTVLAEKVLTLARGGIDMGLIVPSSIVQLAKTATEGTLMKTKWMVAATLLATGLMLTTAGGVVPAAQDQDPPMPVASQPRTAPQPPAPTPTQPPVAAPTQPPVAAPTQPPAPALIPAPQPPAPGSENPGVIGLPGPLAPPNLAAPTPVYLGGPVPHHYEHAFFDVPATKSELVKLVRKQEAAGWEFAGQAGEAKESQLIFKRLKVSARQPQPMHPPLPPAPTAPAPAPGGLSPLPELKSEPAPPSARPVAPTPVGVIPPTAPTAPLPPRGVQPPKAPSEPAGDDLIPMTTAPILETPRTIPVEGVPQLAEPESPRNPPMVRDSNTIPSSNYPVANQPQPPIRVAPATTEPQEIHIVELKHANPKSMAEHIIRFFAEAEVSQDADTNSLLIRCGKKTLADIKKLVEKLDKPAKNRGREMPMPSEFLPSTAPDNTIPASSGR